MPILEISSLEYLRTRSNSQIKADFIDYLRMADVGPASDQPSPDCISSAYRRLAASEPVKLLKPGEKPERREQHTFKMTDDDDLSVVFLNMLEALRVSIAVGVELPWAQGEACKMKILQGKTYVGIGKALGCDRSTARRYVDKALTRMVERVRQDAEEQAKRDAER